MSHPTSPENRLTREELIQFARMGRLNALLDACDAPSVFDKIRELPENQVRCLYINRAEEDFSAFAPYLLSVGPDVFDWVCEAVSQEGGGVFVIADADQDTLHKHFRRFLLVLDPEGEEMYFRFYDPRVLPKFLAACTEAERRDLFGPILAFGIIQEEIATLLVEKSGSFPTSASHRPARIGLFQIRPDHMRAFKAEGEQAFEFRLAEHLREYQGALVNVLSDDKLLLLLRNGIARARNYKLSSEADLAAFVAVMFAIAPNFDRHPYIQDVLTDSRIQPNEKMDALIKRVPNFVWEEAGRKNNPMAWLEPGKEII